MELKDVVAICLITIVLFILIIVISFWGIPIIFGYFFDLLFSVPHGNARSILSIVILFLILFGARELSNFLLEREKTKRTGETVGIKVIAKEQITQYVGFFKNYYPIKELKLFIAIVDEKDWERIFTWQREMRGCAARNLNWKDVEAFTTKSSNVLLFLDLDQFLAQKRMEPLTKIVEGTEFSIFMRESVVKDKIGFLMVLFHEIIHCIEFKLKKSFFRRSTTQQEVRDQKEIIQPYVKQFLSDPSKF